MTHEQLRQLMAEAAEAGDLDQVDLCSRALRGDSAAVQACTAAIASAVAMLED